MRRTVARSAGRPSRPSHPCELRSLAPAAGPCLASAAGPAAAAAAAPAVAAGPARTRSCAAGAGAAGSAAGRLVRVSASASASAAASASSSSESGSSDAAGGATPSTTREAARSRSHTRSAATAAAAGEASGGQTPSRAVSHSASWALSARYLPTILLAEVPMPPGTAADSTPSFRVQTGQSCSGRPLGGRQDPPAASNRHLAAPQGRAPSIPASALARHAAAAVGSDAAPG
mmetsp:Transcript_4106/g.17226  ORF Transcript_4106/g.17226 Transcript_4106/m.17226 type:complete len:232 (+) Transcript_4106:513-1208(+)